MSKRIKICIEKNGLIYNVTSIYLLSDGSFKIDVPYCPYDQGVAMKFPVDYRKRDFYISVNDVVEKFKSTNRPQLTIHASGFVHFSGKGIRSGIYTITGKPKGIGLYSRPLDNPIHSGPTAAVVVWGLDKFEFNSNSGEKIINFREDHFTKRNIQTETDNLTPNTYNLEIFVFPEKMAPGIIKMGNGEVATFQFYNYAEQPGAIFTFPVIRLKNHSSFLGVLPFLTFTNFPFISEYGFQITSPSGLEKSMGSESFFCIKAEYPNFMFPDINETLDYL